jgi:L-alanine-DL-glutamate epimerase-like enolase superfamily enzyme
MKITEVRTYNHEDFPNLIQVEVRTDEGITGTGESYYFGSSIAAFINEFLGPTILGEDPLNHEALAEKMHTYVGYNGSGIETRGRSAIDIAIWDIKAQAAGQPLYQYLGGKHDSSIRFYNTCAGRGYMRKSNQSSKSWGIDQNSDELEDLKAFLTDAGELSQNLLADGITGMKIWPLDVYAEKNNGQDISDEDLKVGLEPFRKIRERVGNKMDIMLELHGLWSPVAAKKIFDAVKEFDLFWVEDPIYPDLVDELSILRGAGMPRIAHGETVASQTRVNQLCDRGLIDVLTLDLGWCGGFTQGLKMVEKTKQTGVKIAPHDCTGPIGLIAGLHLSLASENALIQETVRASLRTWYPHVVTDLPTISGERISLGKEVGLGVSLKKEFTGSPQMKSVKIS